MKNDFYDVMIIGGSFAGLSAALGLGRSLRSVMVVDARMPANRKTAQSQNFLTHDGQSPDSILAKARKELNKYSNVHFYKDIAVRVTKNESGFATYTTSGVTFNSSKLLLATGVIDIMPSINGISECWGKSYLHCPFCHGYEVRFGSIGVLGNGDEGFDLVRHIHQWTKKLTLFTNGFSLLSSEQVQKLTVHHIDIIEDSISAIEQQGGQMEEIIFKDGLQMELSTLFGRAGFRQSCDIPHRLGCLISHQGYIGVDEYLRTSVPGIYAAGDNVTAFRTISSAVAGGTRAAAFINKDLIEETF